MASIITNPNSLWIRADHWEQMVQEVRRWAPEEACGLVAGQGKRSVAVFAVENSLHSPVRFRMEPRQQLAAQLELMRLGWDLLAIYHSHPAGPPAPSAVDIGEAAYPDAATLIWSPMGEEWICRAFYISEGVVQAIKVVRYL